MAEQDATGGSIASQLVRAMRAVVGIAHVANDGATLARFARSIGREARCR